MNSIYIRGNLTRDPETRYTTGGKAVCEFAIAHNERRGDDKEHVSYFDIVAWEKLAEACGEALTKGSPVVVAGKMSQQRWQTKEGDNRSKHVIVAREVTFIEARGERKSQEPTQPNDPPPPDDNTPESSDDLPF